MDFIEELKWRGMLHDATPSVEEHLSNHKTAGYIGFDPTAPALTIGNYVQIMLLKLFQLSGHQPIVLMGGATGRIGDPSGKDKERQLKSGEELDANLVKQQQLFYKFLHFEGVDNPAVVVNNLDFYKHMNVLDFLRDVGKNLTVNYMLSKDSVKNRLESGLSFTEFSYQLLQAYDYLCLYRNHECRLQMGGSDQWGNITSGTEFIRRNVEDSKAYAITTPLLTKADGSKFGKSEEGNIWLDPAMTSPYKFYQFWINADDRDLPKFIRYFTLKSREEVEALEKEYADDPRSLKKILAEELTVRIHSQEDYEAVQNVSDILFNKKASKEQLLSLNESSFQAIKEEIPSFEISKDKFKTGIPIINLLAEDTTIVQSNGDARRAIKGNAISVNKDKITSHEAAIDSDALILDKYMMVENGKKNKYIIIAN
ncbi:MAG: tyrosine--tRNA ligase [Bacteroidia bacterium]|nr:tyrosine--tRNA ligase [Bacteroidia bacterium]